MNREPFYVRAADALFGPLYPLTVLLVAAAYAVLVYWITG